MPQHKKPHPSPRRATPGPSLFEQYRDKLQRFIGTRIRATHNANDIAQEVYLRLLRFPPAELVRRPQAYLYRIASNVVHDFNLRGQNDPVTFDSRVVDELAEYAADVWVDEPGDTLDAEQEIERVLAKLPPGPLAALLLLKRDGLSYEEIARELHISIHTVKKYVARAIAHCRAADLERGARKG